MAQRFNPPPGWQVGPDFVPPAGWQPDPSWPPAPPGWNFWVEDATPAPGAYGAVPTQASPAHAHDMVAGARKQLLIGIAVLAVGLVVNVVSYLNPGSDGRFSVWWGLPLVGLVLVIRSLIAYVRAKKIAGATAPGFDPNQYTSQPPSSFGPPPGVTPPGQGHPAPPAQPYPGDGGPRPGEYRP